MSEFRYIHRALLVVLEHCRDKGGDVPFDLSEAQRSAIYCAHQQIVREAAAMRDAGPLQ